LTSRTAKTTTLFAAVMIAMLAVGISYAMWDKYLRIDGTVYTGEINGVWTSATNFDLGLDPEWGFQTTKDKDVGSTTVTGINTQELVVTVNNAYPSYCNDIEVEFTNTGTIPVKIQSIAITPDNFALASAYGADDGEIYAAFVDGIGTQLEPGDPAASSFKFHVEQSAEQLTTYTFTVAVRLVQWNEYTP
jgi:hypothetical protein